MNLRISVFQKKLKKLQNYRILPTNRYISPLSKVNYNTITSNKSTLIEENALTQQSKEIQKSAESQKNFNKSTHKMNVIKPMANSKKITSVELLTDLNKKLSPNTVQNNLKWKNFEDKSL